MAANLSQLEFKKYYGQNDTAAPGNLTFEAVSIKNFLIRELGRLKRRPGQTQIGADTGLYKQLGLTHYTLGATKVQIKVEDTVIQSLSGETWSTMSGGTGLTAGKPMNFCFANDFLYGFNGTDTVRKINDTTVTTVAGIPKGAWAIWWRNILFVGGVEAYKNRVYFSNIGDPETFGVDSYFDIESGDGDYLTGGIAMKDKVLFSKSQSWHYMVGSGTNTFAIYPITHDFGSVSFRSSCQFGNDVWCVSVEGRVMSVLRNQYGLFDGADMSSEFLEGTFSRVNKNALSEAIVVSVDQYLLVALPTGSSTYNDLVLVYDAVCPTPNGKSKWTTITGWSPSCFDIFPDGGVPRLFMGEAQALGRVYKWAGNNDNGVVINCEWIGPEMTLGSEGQKKRFQFSKWSGEPLGDYDAKIWASVDQGGFTELGKLNFLTQSPGWGTFVWGTGLWGTTGQVKSGPIHYSANGGKVIGTKVQDKITYAEDSDEISIGTHICYYQVKRFRNK